MIDRQGCILLIYKMNNTAFQIIVEYRTKYSNKIIFSKLVTVYYFTCQTYPWRQEKAIYNWNKGKKQTNL